MGTRLAETQEGKSMPDTPDKRQELLDLLKRIDPDTLKELSYSTLRSTVETAADGSFGKSFGDAFGKAFGDAFGKAQ